MSLSKIECDRAVCPPGKSRVRLADGHGMYLEVTAAGGKYWRMKYRHVGKEKRLALGVYPAVSLAEARKKRDKARNALLEGEDPAQTRRDAKLARALPINKQKPGSPGLLLAARQCRTLPDIAKSFRMPRSGA